MGYGEIKSLGQIRFLTDDQIKLYRDAIIGPIERTIIEDTMISRVVSHGVISSQGLDFNSLLNKEELQVSLTVLSKYYLNCMGSGRGLV